MNHELPEPFEVSRRCYSLHFYAEIEALLTSIKSSHVHDAKEAYKICFSQVYRLCLHQTRTMLSYFNCSCPSVRLSLTCVGKTEEKNNISC